MALFVDTQEQVVREYQHISKSLVRYSPTYHHNPFIACRIIVLTYEGPSTFLFTNSLTNLLSFILRRHWLMTS